MNFAIGLGSALSKMDDNFIKYTFDNIKNNPNFFSNIKNSDVIYICVSLWDARLQSCSINAAEIAKILRNTSCKHVLILLEYDHCQIKDIDRIMIELPFMFKQRVKDTEQKGFFDEGLGFDCIQIYFDNYNGNLVKEIIL